MPDAASAINIDIPTLDLGLNTNPEAPEKTYIEIDAKKMFLAVIIISSVFGCVVFGIFVYCIGRCVFSTYSEDDQVVQESYEQQDLRQQLPNESLD